jgi:1-acyl-sn-glycerol-3-phosphate acyltransferase
MLWRFMSRAFARFFRRHMNALRLAIGANPPTLNAARTRLVVYSNHPAWWDAAVYVLAADRLFPAFAHFAPIDAEMLHRYAMFARMGAFGIDLEHRRGAREFLAAASEVLGEPGRALWVTAQGRFSDVRERPLGLKAGVARLAEIAPEAIFVPMAMEYAFWTERGAEAFIAFGPPITGQSLLALDRNSRRDWLEAELTGVLDRLSADVQARDPGRFDTLLEGRAGIGGIYDLLRLSAARWRGEAFDPGHHKGDPE